MTKVRKTRDDRDKFSRLVQKQYEDLFSEEDTPPAPINIRQMEQLKARLAELEAQQGGLSKVREGGTSSTEIAVPPPIAKTPAEVPVLTATTRRSIPIASRIRSAWARGAAAISTAAGEFGQSRIQNRLTILVMIVTLPMLIGITAFVSTRAGSQIETSANDDLRQNTEAMAANTSTWLDLNVKTLQELAALPGMVSMDPAQQRPILQDVAAAHPYMYLVSTTDLAGMNVARNDDAAPIDYHDRLWFQNAVAGSPVTFQTLISRTTGRPALVVSLPIRHSSGKIIGVAMFAADLTHLSEETRARTLGNSGTIYLVDANNQVLAHPDPAFTTGELRDLSQYPPIAALRERGEGLVNFSDENGVAWRAYVRTLDNGWAVVTQQQQAEILAPARQFQTVAFSVIGVGALLMLVLSWFSIRRTLQPIGVLTDTVSAIAAGDLQREVKVARGDEIGKLASTFNAMTAQLRNAMGSLEQRVAERTHDLEVASEVGRLVSEKSADIDVLLKEAVELIRERFDLYYTQIYLADRAGRILTLRAGAGEIGAELLRRGHRLLIGPGSINGRAAAEKRAMVVQDTKQSENFLPNPLLPDTRSEMAIPLMAAGKLVGVLDMQSQRAGALNESNQPAFEAMAGQLAVALENAALFVEAREARSDIEEQVRRLSEHGWQHFLDAIQRGHKIGYAAKQANVIALEGDAISPAPTDAISVPIRVTNANIGAIQLMREPDRAWTANEIELIRIAANQLAQHLENLRLVAQAEQYQAQAEETARRLTREGWSVLQTSGEVAPGYSYNLNEVRPLTPESTSTAEMGLRQALVVRNESIGELAARVETGSAEAGEIMAAVAAQLSGHIETLRLSQELQKRAAELQELDRLKTAFMANMSHELRTPLNSILGFSDVILQELDGPLTETMSNDLQLIQNNGQQLLNLINDVLDMAKIEAGGLNLNPERFNLHETFEEVLNISSPQANAKALSLSIEPGSDPELEIFADRMRIRQVMLNLVNNALKFTDKGSVSVSGSRHDGKILVCVRDTGIGIPPDKLEAIFQEFTQVDTSPTRKVGGTGLGLPISRRLLDMHGGRIWAKSAGVPGEGSTFYVELPIEARIAEPAERLTQ